VHSINDCKSIQNDIDALYDRSCKWKLDFNVLKCKVLIRVTRSHIPIVFDYHMNGEPIERVSEFKDLGVTILDDLSWNNHVNNIVSKANRMMGLIKRTVGYHAPVKVKLQLYTTLVRSNLEYCTQAWNGLSIKNRIKLERVQRAATRYILGFPSIGYSERIVKLNLLPLSFRRDIMDLNFFYKCLNGLNHVDVTYFVRFTSDSTVITRNSRDPNLLKVPLCRTNIYKNSYFNRISYSWNTLPLSIRCANNVNAFKYKLKGYFTALLPNFNPDCCCTLYGKCVCLGNQPV
jgi:hypothetical protein